MAHHDIRTFLWFNDNGHTAAAFYCSLFDDAAVTDAMNHLRDDGTAGPPLVTSFHLNGQHYAALNGGPHYTLTPACSISVTVDTQAEVDRLWTALLSGGGKESQCGWLTDRFGLSWQIVPRQLLTLMAQPDRAAAGRVMAAMMQMVKLDIATLQAASDAP